MGCSLFDVFIFQSKHVEVGQFNPSKAGVLMIYSVQPPVHDSNSISLTKKHFFKIVFGNY